jgi:hypothetical protein
MSDPKALDVLLREANEFYQTELARLQQAKSGEPAESTKSEIAQLRAQQLFGLEGTSFCAAAPETVTMIEGEINSFSWFIPDKIEIPIMAFLKTCDFLLPKLCETAGVSPAKPKVDQNFNKR